MAYLIRTIKLMMCNILYTLTLHASAFFTFMPIIYV